jgi:hypothetical protein
MIAIQSANSITHVFSIDGVLDLSMYTEPTLSVLQSAFDAGDYEIIPDPDPDSTVESPLPNYPAFNIYMLSNSDSMAYDVIVNAINPKLVQAISITYNNIVDRGTADFLQIFPLYCHVAGVTSEHRNQWADKATELNLPADFVMVIRGDQLLG